MQKHVVITTNTRSSIETMLGYSGTQLVHSDPDFAWFECTDLSQADQDAICGYGTAQTVKLVGMMVLNKPPQQEER